MGPVTLNLSPEARLLFNHLRIPMTQADLDDDLVCVVLPNGRRIDVSWSPPHDPTGEYTITVYRDSWENKELEFTTDEIGEIKKIVEYLAQPQQPVTFFGGPASCQNATSGSTAMSIVYPKRVRQHA